MLVLGVKRKHLSQSSAHRHTETTVRLNLSPCRILGMKCKHLLIILLPHPGQHKCAPVPILGIISRNRIPLIPSCEANACELPQPPAQAGDSAPRKSHRHPKLKDQEASKLGIGKGPEHDKCKRPGTTSQLTGMQLVTKSRPSMLCNTLRLLPSPPGSPIHLRAPPQPSSDLSGEGAAGAKKEPG